MRFRDSRKHSRRRWRWIPVIYCVRVVSTRSYRRGKCSFYRCERSEALVSSLLFYSGSVHSPMIYWLGKWQDLRGYKCFCSALLNPQVHALQSSSCTPMKERLSLQGFFQTVTDMATRCPMLDKRQEDGNNSVSDAKWPLAIKAGINSRAVRKWNVINVSVDFCTWKDGENCMTSDSL